jgi:hypothetical protein
MEADVEESVNWVLNLGEHHIDIVVLFAGSLFGYLLTLALELWFLPSPVSDAVRRHQKGYTFLFCWLTSATASALMWWALDPADSLHVRVTVSLIVSIVGFFGYPLVAKYLTSKFPAIGSAWDGISKL